MSRYNLVSKREYPEPPYQCDLVEIDIPSVPFMVGALWLRSQKYWWKEPDAKDGRWAMNRAMEALAMGCGKDIVAALDRMYTLQDWFFNANQYTYTPGENGAPGTYDPPLPATPNFNPFNSTSTSAILHTLMWASYNLLNGQANPNYGFEDTRNFRTLLEEIKTALATGDEAAQTALLQKIALALGAAL